MNPCCSTCRFWVNRHSGMPEKGECRTSPPVVVPMGGLDAGNIGTKDVYLATWWPVTLGSDWCGAYQMKREGDQ